jgi:hypothetical protein
MFGIPVAAASTVVAHGVELEVPKGWVQKKGAQWTVYTPKKFRNRAVVVAPTKTVPSPTPIDIEAWFSSVAGITKLKIEKASEQERNGSRQVIGLGVAVVNETPVRLSLVVLPLDSGAVALISFIGGDQDPAVIEADLKIVFSARPAASNMEFKVLAPKSANVAAAPKTLAALLNRHVTDLSKVFKLPRTLKIYLAECGTSNAWYSPSEHNIQICHEYFASQQKVFSSLGLKPEQAAMAAHHSIVFTFYHELGHALQFEMKLAATGKAEDFADEFAAVMMSGAGEDGFRAASSKVLYFDQRSKQRAQDAYWDTHSLDAQRVASISCILFGKDPKRYAPLMKHLKAPQSRLVRCPSEYKLKRDTIFTVLKPYLR